jgi:hypothetical protein
VSVKYKTKNIKTDCKEVFLATINQSSADTISSRNFNPIATILYKGWLSGSFACPFKKIMIVINAMSENTVDKMIISAREIFGFATNTNIYPHNNKRTYNNKSGRKYLKTFLKEIITNKSNKFKNQDLNLICSIHLFYP